jgi:hypothetical protein
MTKSGGRGNLAHFDGLQEGSFMFCDQISKHGKNNGYRWMDSNVTGGLDEEDGVTPALNVVVVQRIQGLF